MLADLFYEDGDDQNTADANETNSHHVRAIYFSKGPSLLVSVLFIRYPGRHHQEALLDLLVLKTSTFNLLIMLVFPNVDLGGLHAI